MCRKCFFIGLSGVDYEGNMISDTNKDINTIRYNHLNLPVKVLMNNPSDGSLTFVYTADGQKVAKNYIAFPNGNEQLYDYRYFNRHHYIFHQPFFINLDKSYIKFYTSKTDPIPGAPLYQTRYYYQYYDHLGNVRLSYSDTNKNGEIDLPYEIINENNYYPYGLEHKGYNDANGDAFYRYQYNNKELNPQLGLNWYDYGARFYDPAIARWGSVDPLAENYYSYSPYNYVMGNPILFVDPDGMDVNFAFKNKETKKEDKANLLRQLNEGLAGYYTASIDKKGYLSLIAVKGMDFSEASDQVKGFYDVLNQSVSADGTVKINVLNGDDNVVVGSFDDQAIDMKDLAAFENVDNTSGLPNATSAQSKIAHEITEQYDRQINGNKDFPSAHERAIQAENRVSGSMRGEDLRNISNPQLEVRPTVFVVGGVRVIVTVTQDSNKNSTKVKQQLEKK
ncbi:MAG: RHS repeat-associated core domain-containing protein [Chitinophagales bacterium]|nr:hypothetical protein [Bacteroidota bacterium]MCB9044419.1 hypothetical protein [Chitinophagales bacterium]